MQAPFCSHHPHCGRFHLDGEILISLRPKGKTEIATIARDLNVSPKQIRRQITRINERNPDSLIVSPNGLFVHIAPEYRWRIRTLADVYWSRSHSRD